MAEDSDSCLFQCSKVEQLSKASADRIKSIISASKLRGDELHHILSEKLEANPDFTVSCHRSCVSTYTSKTHIARYKKKQSEESRSDEPLQKRSRRSDASSFTFKEDCLFCGKRCEEKDPKHPDRWRRYSIIRTVTRKGNHTFKDVILSVCQMRNDKWSAEVLLRLAGATSDLHAADGRYYNDCNKLFMHSSYLERLAKVDQHHDKFDNALGSVIDYMVNDQTHIWNSVELFDMYHEFGGWGLARPMFISSICDHFDEEVIKLQSPGLASLFVFRKSFAKHLVETDEENISVRKVAVDIRKESRKADKSVYNIRLSGETLSAGVSQTLLRLLEELNLPDLPALLVGSVITSSLTKSSTQLQLAMSNLVKRKALIEELHHFGVTTTYDEFRRFKASAAVANVDSRIEEMKSCSKLIQAVGDNYDATISSPNGLKQTHCMAVIITHEQEEQSPKDQQTCRLKKEDMKTTPTPDIDLCRYNGPKNPPMPVAESNQNW